MARNKFPVHTTLSSEAVKILERYEKELGAKNLVLEKALLSLDSTKFKSKIDINNIDKVIKRVSTGVAGLDDMLEGGVPKGSSVIVTGPPGTGKTTLCMQFLMEGVKADEKCLFFSFEERIPQLIQHFMRFGWDLGSHIDDGYLEIFGMSMLTFEEIGEIIETYKPQRIVFDSLNVFTDPEEFRKSISWRSLHKLLKKLNITTFLVTEKENGMEKKVYDKYDFVGDGIIFLDKMQINEVEPTLTPVLAVQKMRATKVDTTPQPFRFTDKGISKYRTVNLMANKLQERMDVARSSSSEEPRYQ
ncbi:RAD55 family ATPase [Methanococcoides burtonii]|uniref:KaiC domain-containing protein n=1 Tax=Methanococcoides burtonii (strain DSM 6242 / NBRC 107633 / OCM 468 / ACE-M) TaxID=259564 RepID=Q12XV7_METBU|nr:ATPase domain-containing protein [Methanococcoides burtonii]ABE51719.1 KaiC domain-containing protein [Methanococcoides burtonii DSM 6242]